MRFSAGYRALNVRIPTDMFAALDAVAAREDVPVSVVVRRAIEALIASEKKGRTK